MAAHLRYQFQSLHTYGHSLSDIVEIQDSKKLVNFLLAPNLDGYAFWCTVLEKRRQILKLQGCEQLTESLNELSECARKHHRGSYRALPN